MALNLDAIKTAVQNVMTDNNTITSGGLSESLSDKVSFIAKTNPERIMFDVDKYPFVTSYFDNYAIVSDTHARNQTVGTRIATIDMKVVGGIWNPNFAARDSDPADDDLELLMRNIETVLRANTDLSATVDYHKPNDVRFHTFVDEEDDAHIRIGIMDVEITKRY